MVAAWDSGLTPADRLALGGTRTAVAGLAGVISGVAAPGPLLSSPDGNAVVFSVSITGRSSGGNSKDRDLNLVTYAPIMSPPVHISPGLGLAS